MLKALLKQRHLQAYRSFCREYDRVARKADPSLMGSYPSKAQYYRWLSGGLLGLPYGDHCRILGYMFPRWSAEELFRPYAGSLDFTSDPVSGYDGIPHLTKSPAVAVPADLGSEIVGAYPYRSQFPVSAWWDLISNATRQIDLLGYTLYFLAMQHPELVQVLRKKCESGCVVRAAIADPASQHVAYRDAEEDQPITLVVRINSTIKHLTPLLNCVNFQIRYQDIPLYNSIFRFDDEMLVTPHLYATTGASAPLLHLRRIDSGGMFGRFASHFEDVWAGVKPVDWSSKSESVVRHGKN